MLAQLYFRIPVLVLVTLLSACTIYRQPGEDTAPVDQPPGSAVVVPPATMPKPRPAEPPASAAWRSLLDKAEQATDRGDYEQALALLERAQRIDPDSAEIYLCMARTHRARGDTAQSRATAERGLLYCATNRQCEALQAYVR